MSSSPNHPTLDLDLEVGPDSTRTSAVPSRSSTPGEKPLPLVFETALSSTGDSMSFDNEMRCVDDMKEGEPKKQLPEVPEWIDDPEHPYNWTPMRRWYGTFVPGYLCLVVTFASSVFATGVYEIAEKFEVSLTTALLGLSLYVLGLGLGPMLSAPLSEVYGRRPAYAVNLPLFIAFTLGSGLAHNFPTLLVTRTLAGVFGGPTLAISAASFVDIWPLKTSAPAVTVQAMATFLGPALGPVVGGYLVEAAGWRWTMYTVCIMGAVGCVLVFFLTETHHRVIQERLAPGRGVQLPEKLSAGEGLRKIITITLATPVKMLLREPIVQAVSVYSSFAFAVLFGFFDAFPFTFMQEYRFGLGATGLCFLGITIGLCLGCVLYLVQDRLVYQPAYVRYRGDPPPELRLVPAMIGSFLMPLGLFWFAWTASEDIHWIVPVIAGAPFGAGLVLVFLTAVMYMMEVYPPEVAASAMAAMGLLRYVLACAFPLFTIRMFEVLGIGWATSVYGFVAVGLMPIPWVFKRWGEAIRKRSRMTKAGSGK